MAFNFASGSEFIEALAAQLGMADRSVRRIIIDCPYDGAVMVYVEMFGTTELLDIQLPDVSECKVQVLKCE